MLGSGRNGDGGERGKTCTAGRMGCGRMVPIVGGIGNASHKLK